jgi:enoyl-CoA hydratase
LFGRYFQTGLHRHHEGTVRRFSLGWHQNPKAWQSRLPPLFRVAGAMSSVEEQPAMTKSPVASPVDDDLLYAVEGGIGLVMLNRPKARNALTFEMYARLGQICREAKLGGPVRVIIITGAGDKAFAAGTDISKFRSFKSGADGVAYEATMAREFDAIDACEIPTIAAISGACTGGGAAIAACCDIRIATSDMKYGFPIARTLGNCLSAGNLAKLISIVGVPRVTNMLLTAQLIEAPEALASGLVTELLPNHAALMARAMALAAQLATHAPLTMSVTKELLRRLRTSGPSVEDADQIARAYGSADFHEGLEAFLAKRTPQWTGR